MAIMTALVLLAVLCIVLAVCAIKWYVVGISTFYILAQHGIEPTKNEAKEAAIDVVKYLLKYGRKEQE